MSAQRRFLIALCVCTLIIWHTPGSALAQELAANKPPYHYALIMSKDDKLCLPLIKFYDEMLKAKSWNTDPIWEDKRSAELEKLGFTAPEKFVDSRYPSYKFVQADLFQEGKPRIISEVEDFHAGEYFTRVDIMKAGKTYEEFQVLGSGMQTNPDVLEDLHLNDAVNAQIGPGQAAPLIGYINGAVTHYLTEWPDFKHQITMLKSDPLHTLIYYLNSGSIYRLMKYNGKYIFLSRYPIPPAPHGEPLAEGSPVSAFYIGPGKEVHDQCYLTLAPSNLASEGQKEH